MSPLFRVNRVSTPTLVVCGEKDLRTPLSQSEQWYQALRRVGVEAELVIYPGQGHSMDWSSQEDFRRPSLAWFDRFLEEPPPSPAAAADIRPAP
jgi:dipeptidyl aminopeptidase/acylaminoacyl peptidase